MEAGGDGPPGRSAAARYWIDAQLPPSLAAWLRSDFGSDAQHVVDLGLLTTSDAAIFEAARSLGTVVIVTKDDDFRRLLDRQGPPPQVVWVTCGNVRNATLRTLLLRVWPDVVRRLEAGDPLVEIG